jgi:hypothetical protein
VHSPTNFFEQSVTLLHIVSPTRSNHVGPLVTSAATSRHHVIDRVGVFEAIGASIAIAQE